MGSKEESSIFRENVYKVTPVDMTKTSYSPVFKYEKIKAKYVIKNDNCRIFMD